jgi:hypothetical protein
MPPLIRITVAAPSAATVSGAEHALLGIRGEGVITRIACAAPEHRLGARV